MHAMGFVGWLMSGAAASAVACLLTTLTGFVGSFFLVGAMALVTGSLVGGAVRYAATTTQGWGPGLTGAAIAFAAIMCGKVGAFYVWTGEMTDALDDDWTMQDEIADATSESALVSDQADEVVDEWLASGRITTADLMQFEAELPEDEEYDDEAYIPGTYDHSRDYPPEIWKEAEARWSSRTKEEQREIILRIRNSIRDDWGEPPVGEEDVLEPDSAEADGEQQFKLKVAVVMALGNIFLPFSSLFFMGSGILAAFRISSNMAVND